MIHLKKSVILLAAMIPMAFLLYGAYAQTTASKKTITLPNGDVVFDLNGEWDVLGENYGPWSQFGSSRNVIKITQTGSSFFGIRMHDSPWLPAGSMAIQGELEKNGFKNVRLGSGAGPLDAEGNISEDGNSFLVDDGQKARGTFTRK